MIKYIFDNKVAIITGAGIGIGYEIAKRLSLAGAKVVLNDLDANLAVTASRGIQKLGGKCIAVGGDCSQLETIDELVKIAVQEFGCLDYAIANAGITTFGSFLDYKLESLQKLMKVNLQGSFFLAHAAAKQIVKQKSKGRILFMSSVTGHQAHPNLAAYGMTKSALEMLAKNLGVELAKHRITINAIAPGATLTERTLESNPKYMEEWKSLTPSGVVSTPQDIANAALFLLSEESAQITGQSIIVDGGWTAVSPPPGE